MTDNVLPKNPDPRVVLFQDGAVYLGEGQILSAKVSEMTNLQGKAFQLSLRVPASVFSLNIVGSGIPIYAVKYGTVETVSDAQ